MTQIKAVFFDCDGTLVDSEHAHYASWKHALEKQGFDFTVDEYKAYVGNSTNEIASRLAEKTNRPCVEEIFSDKINHFRLLLKEGIPPIRPTVDFVRRLAKQQELKLGVTSAAPKEEILTHLDHLKLAPLFDIVISGQDDLSAYSDPEGVNKPKPYIYLHAAKLLNLDPAECVVIEDSSTGVTAGAGAKCITVAVPNEYSTHQDFSKAHLKIPSFQGIGIDQFLQMAIDSHMK